MHFQSPTTHLTIERFSDAFVDDTQNGLNDSKGKKPWTLRELLSGLTAMATTWERLLFCSGGALELTKCSYYVRYWMWQDGLPRMLSQQEIDRVAQVKPVSGNALESQLIAHCDVSKATKTLGVWLAPDGNEKAQISHLRSKATQVSSLLISSRLTKLEAQLAYIACWLPAITYALGTTTLTASALTSIQAPATQSFLQKMGLNKNHPRAAAFGPLMMGGLAMKDLYIEQGIARIRGLLSHIFNSTDTGKMMLITIHNLQMEAGTERPILNDPTISLPYLTEGWVTSTRKFLSQHQIQVELTDSWNFRAPRKHDHFLMDVFRTSKAFTNHEMCQLNKVRLFLQVATLSDNSTAAGKHITENAFIAVPDKQRKSVYEWIRQPEISVAQATLWNRALRQQFTFQPYSTQMSLDSRKLKIPLGPWTDTPNQVWRHYYNPNDSSLLIYKHPPSARVYSFAFSSRYAQYFHRPMVKTPKQIIKYKAHLIPIDLLPTENHLFFKRLDRPHYASMYGPAPTSTQINL